MKNEKVSAQTLLVDSSERVFIESSVFSIMLITHPSSGALCIGRSTRENFISFAYRAKCASTHRTKSVSA